jgi:hypothetical protein
MNLLRTLKQILAAPQSQRILFVLLVTGLLVGGWLVRVRAYRDSRSLYVDEACLAMNVLNRGFSGLTQPLADNQAAPVLFLWSVKAFTLWMGESEEALRLTSFLASLFSLPVIFLAGLKLSGRRGALLGLFFAAVSPALIGYTTVLKQYMWDGAVAALLICLSLVFLDGKKNWPWVLGWSLAGGLAVWASFPAVYTLAACGIAWFVQLMRETEKRDRSLWYKVTFVGTVWLGSFIACYLNQMRDLQQVAYLQDYWRGGFPSNPEQGWGFWEWFLRVPQSAFDVDGSFLFIGAGALFVVLGALFVLKSKKPAGLVMVLPGVLAVLGALLHTYPLQGRVAVFLVPGGLLLAAHGIETIASLMKQHRFLFLGTAVLLTAAYPSAQALDSSLRNLNLQELRPVVRRILEQRQPGDSIYVYYAGKCSFSYYARQFQIRPSEYELADEWTGRLATDRIAYLTGTFQPLQGRQHVWIVFTHVRFNDLNDGLAILNHMGQQLYVYEKPGSSVYLYDFSDPPINTSP